MTFFGGQQVALTDDDGQCPLSSAKAPLKVRGGLASSRCLQVLEDLHVTEQFVCLPSQPPRVRSRRRSRCSMSARISRLRLMALDVTGRIDRAFNMHDAFRCRSSGQRERWRQSRGCGQELVVPQTLALLAPPHQTGDVHELDHRRRGLLCVIEIGQRGRRRSSGTATMPTFGSMVQNG